MNIEMTIGPDGGKVIQKFKSPVDLVEYDPENAITIAEALTTAAFEARDGMKPVSDTLKAELVERHRAKLSQRLAVVMNSKRENPKITNAALARELVDICLREIF